MNAKNVTKMENKPELEKQPETIWDINEALQSAQVDLRRVQVEVAERQRALADYVNSTPEERFFVVGKARTVTIVQQAEDGRIIRRHVPAFRLGEVPKTRVFSGHVRIEKDTLSVYSKGFESGCHNISLSELQGIGIETQEQTVFDPDVEVVSEQR